MKDEDFVKWIEEMLEPAELRRKQLNQSHREHTEKLKEFIEKFEKICNEIIRPVLEAARISLNKKTEFVTCFVKSYEEPLSGPGKQHLVELRLYISAPNSIEPKDNDRHISFIASKPLNEISIIKHTGSIPPQFHKLENRQIPLEKITKEFVQQEVIEYLEKLIEYI